MFRTTSHVRSSLYRVGWGRFHIGSLRRIMDPHRLTLSAESSILLAPAAHIALCNLPSLIPGTSSVFSIMCAVIHYPTLSSEYPTARQTSCRCLRQDTLCVPHITRLGQNKMILINGKQSQRGHIPSSYFRSPSRAASPTLTIPQSAAVDPMHT